MGHSSYSSSSVGPWPLGIGIFISLAAFICCAFHCLRRIISDPPPEDETTQPQAPVDVGPARFAGIHHQTFYYPHPQNHFYDQQQSIVIVEDNYGNHPKQDNFPPPSYDEVLRQGHQFR